MARAQEYAKLHRNYLKNSHPKMYQALKEKGELVSHLAGVGQEASEMYDSLEAQMATSNRLPEKYQDRVDALERIPHVVDEIVRDELIYNNPPPPQR